MPNTKKWYQHPAVWIGIVASIVCVALLLMFINVPELIGKIGSADIRLIVLGGAMIVSSAFFRTLRWQVVLGKRPNFRKIFHAENVGYLVNSILPIRAGEPARAYLVSAGESSPSFVEAFSTVVIDRVTDMIALVALLGVALSNMDVPDLVKAAGDSMLLVVVVAIVVLIVGAYAQAMVLTVVRKISGRMLPARIAEQLVDWAEHFLAGLDVIRSAPRLVLLVITTSLLWAAYVAFYHFILMAFVPSPILPWSILATCATALSMSVPSSPGFIGVFHMAIIIALQDHIGTDTAAAYAVVLHAMDLGMALIFGVCSLAVTGTSLGRINVAISALTRPESR